MSALNTIIQIIIGIATFAIYWQLYMIFVNDHIKNNSEEFSLFHGICMWVFCFSMRKYECHSTLIALGLFGTCTAIYGLSKYWEMLGELKYMVMVGLLVALPMIGSHVRTYSEFLEQKNK